MERPDAAWLAREIESLEWYHTMELAPGIVTPGWFDHRPVVAKVGLPEDLSGMRCLDVGTFDGFWAFDLERRGAEEVVAIDLLDPGLWDWPRGASPEVMEAIGRRKGTGRGFELAKSALLSNVVRVERSVYDLRPASDGMFDLVYVGSLLLHLRDPVLALERVSSVCRGQVILVDAVHLVLSAWSRPLASLDGNGRPWWWRPNLSGLFRMAEAAGLRPTGPARLVLMPPGEARRARRPPLRSFMNLPGMAELLAARFGEPHGVLFAEPIQGA